LLDGHRTTADRKKENAMSIHQMLSALALVATLASTHVSRAESAADSGLCFVDPQSVFTVLPYYGPPTLSRRSLERLRGVEIRLVPAVDLSTEQLAARLKQVLRTSNRDRLPACLLGVGRVHIGSNAMGDAESALLIARDPGAAKEVLRRAQLLVGGSEGLHGASARAAR
jgi:hypothetical protein